MGCEREQCPAENAEPDDVKKNANNDHSDGSRDKDCKGRAFHHHHGAIQRIADLASVWNPLRSSCGREQAMQERATKPPLLGRPGAPPLPSFETKIWKSAFRLSLARRQA